MNNTGKWLIIGSTLLFIAALVALIKFAIPSPQVATNLGETPTPQVTVLPRTTLQPSPEVLVSETMRPTPSQETLQPKETIGASTARLYDPAHLGIGDWVGRWKVIDMKETYGKGSKVFIVEGEEQISGTFIVNYEDIDYNSSQIILLADENSSKQLPMPQAFKGKASRMILHASNPNVLKLFGEPGTKGNVTVTITKYQTVYADILEGVADTAVVDHVTQITTTPPPLTEVPQAELTQALLSHPFVPIVLNETNLNSTTNYERLQDWFVQLGKQYINGLSPLTPKRISPDQKDQIQLWLTQAFTPAQIEEIAALSITKSGIHYLVSGGVLPLRPYSEVKEIKSQSLQAEGSDTLRYTGVYILSGTHDAQFTYTLKRIDGVWKIDQFELKLI